MSGVWIPECWIGVRRSSIRLSSTPLSARLRCRSVYWPFHRDAVGVQSDCSQLVADLRTDKSRTSQLTSIQRGTRRQEAMMSDSSTVRSMSHVVVHSSRRRGDRSTRPRDGKIKAAGCGVVGRRKNVDASGLLYEVRLRTTACRFPQPLATSRLRAPRARHDPRR
jgi:hypothetical protein